MSRRFQDMRGWVFVLAGAILLPAILMGSLPATAATLAQASTPTPTAAAAPVMTATPVAGVTSEVPQVGDWERVQQTGKLVVGTSADYQPFAFYNSNFELDGFDIALMKQLAERLGIKVEFKDFAFSGLLDALRLGQVDAAIGALSITPDRSQVVDFTQRYYVADDAVLVRSGAGLSVRSLTDLAQIRVGVERGTTYQHYIQQSLIDTGLSTQEQLIGVEGVTELIRKLVDGEVDAVYMGYLPARDLDRSRADITIAGARFNVQQFGIAVRKGSSLLAPLDQALTVVQEDGTFADLTRLYLNADADLVGPTGDNSTITLKPVEPTATPAVQQKLPTPTPTPVPCVNGLGYVADINYDDQGMAAPPVMGLGQDFVKIWRVRNTGTCAWEPDFTLVYVNGNRPEARMSSDPLAVGQTVAAGAQVDLALPLRAPQTYGTFQGFYQMRDSRGTLFGQVLWVGIQVPDPNPPPTPTPMPPAPGYSGNPNLRSDNAWVNAGQCTTVRWDVDNVQAVYFVVGGTVMGKGGHDAYVVCPGATETYELRVVDNGGTTYSYWTTISVVDGGGGSASIRFWADRDQIDEGDCTTLRWDVQRVNGVFFNGEGVPGVSQRDICPNSSTTYTLDIVRQDGGQERREVRVRVEKQDSGGDGGSSGGRGPRIDWFKVDRNSIGNGSCVKLNWRVSDAGGVTIFRGSTQVVAEGRSDDEKKDCPPGPGIYEYRLEVWGHTGNSTQSLTVEVRP